LTITRGVTYEGGGGIFNGGVLTVSSSTLRSNYAGSPDFNPGGFGGAIYSVGALTVSNSTLSGNAAGGGSYLYYGDYPYPIMVGTDGGFGGALFIGGGTALIDHSTIANNSTAGGQGDYNRGTSYGGGVYVSGGTVNVRHSTITGNVAASGYGEYIGDPPPPYNTGPSPSYAGGIAAGGVVRLYNSLVANNLADSGPDLHGSITSLGHNLIGNTSDGSGFVASDLLNVDPQLGPLQNNGGTTQTMALLPGSPAINAGINTSAPAYDQRGAGFPRIVGGTIDIGAFESSNVAGKTFVGPGGAGSGGNWSNPANWSPAGVPAASDHVSIAGKLVNVSSSATVAGLTLSGGATMNVTANGNRTLRTSSLSISAYSKLNLSDNDLILDYADASPIDGGNGSAYSGVLGLIQTGRTPSGTWDGAGGIGTSMPHAVDGVTTLAVAEAAHVLFNSGGETALWAAGQTVDATTLIVKYTYVGDADLSGSIDGADYGVIDNWVQFPGTSGYANGDFNLDGVIDGADYGLIDNSIQLQGPPL
jgi:hypothetical protein